LVFEPQDAFVEEQPAFSPLTAPMLPALSPQEVFVEQSDFVPLTAPMLPALSPQEVFVEQPALSEHDFAPTAPMLPSFDEQAFSAQHFLSPPTAPALPEDCFDAQPTTAAKAATPISIAIRFIVKSPCKGSLSNTRVCVIRGEPEQVHPRSGK
jgi:hypothetical protein